MNIDLKQKEYFKRLGTNARNKKWFTRSKPISSFNQSEGCSGKTNSYQCVMKTGEWNTNEDKNCTHICISTSKLENVFVRIPFNPVTLLLYLVLRQSQPNLAHTNTSCCNSARLLRCMHTEPCPVRTCTNLPASSDTRTHLKAEL